MSNVVNQQSAVTAIQAFLQKIYKPIMLWADDKFATKDALETATGVNLTIISEADAHAIWNGYTFTTTD